MSSIQSVYLNFYFSIHFGLFWRLVWGLKFCFGVCSYKLITHICKIFWFFIFDFFGYLEHFWAISGFFGGLRLDPRSCFWVFLYRLMTFILQDFLFSVFLTFLGNFGGWFEFKKRFGVNLYSWATFFFYTSFNSEFWIWLNFRVIFLHFGALIGYFWSWGRV